MKKIKILSLNICGIPFSPNRAVRMKLIIQYIKKTSPDFVTLQEVGDRLLYQNFKKGLSNYFFYPDKAPLLINRSGALLFLSKSPLTDYWFKAYKTKSGPQFPFNIPEIISNKGLQVCEATIGNTRITLLHTHLLANFLGNNSDYKYMREQLNELLSVVETLPPNRRLVLSGDLNFPPTTNLYNVVIKHGFKDPLSGQKAYTHAYKNLNINKFYIKMGLMWANKREDYTLLKEFREKEIKQTIVDDRFRFRGKEYDLSDHYGILTELTV